MKAVGDLKVCSKCRKNRELAWFSKEKHRPGGLYPLCKECVREYNNIRHRQLKETRVVVTTGTKTCSKCKVTKDVNKFSAYPRASDGRQSWCMKCTSTNRKKYYWRNPELSREKSREYCHDNYWKSDGRLMRALRNQEKRGQL